MSIRFCDSIWRVKIRPPRSLLPGGFCSLSRGVQTKNGETLCQSHLADQQLHQLLEKVDWDLAREACQQGCAYCGGKLHRANYERKARGGPQWDRRYSFCCAEQDCRRRRTPESVRFLGRRIYAGMVVVLVTTMVVAVLDLLAGRFCAKVFWVQKSIRQRTSDLGSNVPVTRIMNIKPAQSALHRLSSESPGIRCPVSLQQGLATRPMPQVRCLRDIPSISYRPRPLSRWIAGPSSA